MTTLTILADTEMHYIFTDTRYYVSVRIDDEDYDLGEFTDGGKAGAHAAKWVLDRGLCFAPDSARRISEAQRLDSAVLTLDIERNQP